MARVFAALTAAGVLAAAPAAAADPYIGHMVFFTLKDDSLAARDKLAAACHKHLEGLDGIAFFAVGTLGDAFRRDVNDRDWHVALHVVFESKAAHDAYHRHPAHDRFVEEAKGNMAKVRVFDSQLPPVRVTTGRPK